MAIGDLFFGFFGVVILYLFGSGLYFARYSDAPMVEDDKLNLPNSRPELLAQVRAFMQSHGITEDWLLRNGLEKETLTWEPGSIFGRTTRRQDFGHRLPFSHMEEASEQDLRRILRRGPGLIRYRDGVDCCRSGDNR
jgi:hypothetical protein